MRRRFVGMLRYIPIPLLLLSAVSLHAVPVFIGTGGNTAKGIYQADFDPATGKLTQPELAAEYKNPGFLALHPSKPILYSTGLPNKPFPGEAGSVAAFAIGENNSLKFLGEASSAGKNACHLAVDATGSTVALANYSDGTVTTVKLDANGVPGAAASVVPNNGTGPHKDRQQGPHAHGVYFDKSNTRLYVPYLGLDQVAVYPFDAASGKLGEPSPALRTAPAAGPRHLAFSKDEKHAYVINELDNTMLAASHDGGKFETLGVLPTLPADHTTGTTAEVEVHPNGKFVYGSNRGHDSIVVYRRDPATGTLTFVQHASCGGKTPRHFAIDPSGKWLLCGHQGSETIGVLPLDPDTGKLGEPVQTVTSPGTTCLLFAR